MMAGSAVAVLSHEMEAKFQIWQQKTGRALVPGPFVEELQPYQLALSYHKMETYGISSYYYYHFGGDYILVNKPVFELNLM